MQFDTQLFVNTVEVDFDYFYSDHIIKKKNLLTSAEHLDKSFEVFNYSIPQRKRAWSDTKVKGNILEMSMDVNPNQIILNRTKVFTRDDFDINRRSTLTLQGGCIGGPLKMMLSQDKFRQKLS